MKRKLLITTAVLAVGAVSLALWGRSMIAMPGKSHDGPLAPADEKVTALADALRVDVRRLAETIGERNVAHYDKLVEAAGYLDSSLRAMGYRTERQSYDVDGRACDNIVVDLPGTDRRDEIVIVGAHYDSPHGSPGANDNGSGCAATLALAQAFAGSSPRRTVRFVFFVNEEPPYFQTELMGSLVYARRCRELNENVTAMLSLETIGYYSDEEGSQNYPAPLDLFYPSTGNFIGFAGNTGSADLVREVIASFRRHAQFPSEGAALPDTLPGIGWSDHWSFWQVGYPAVMITDTAPFRYPHYHTPDDTPEKIDYERMARVVLGVEQVVGELASP